MEIKTKTINNMAATTANNMGKNKNRMELQIGL